jgi:outer membrane protein
MKKIFLFSILLFIPFSFIKSETYVLDLNKSIEIAKEKSYDMLSLIQDFKIAEYNLKVTTSTLKTHIDMNFVAPNYNNTLDHITDSTGIRYYKTHSLNYSGDLTITQPLPTDGSISLTSGLLNDDDYINKLRSPRFSSTIEIKQSINSLFGYNKINSDLKLAKLSYESSRKRLKREELNLIYQVSNSFYNLLSVQKSSEIAKLNLERQQEAQTISKNKFDAGLIKEVDALQMEVDLAEAQNNYDLAIATQNSAMNDFKQLIGINFNDSISLNSELKYEIVIVDVEKAVQLAFQNRLEIREQEIQIEQTKTDIKKKKSEGKIQANISAYYQKYGVKEQSINTKLNEAIKNSYNDLFNNTQNYGIGFIVKVPILDGGENRAKVNAAEATLKQNLLRKEDVERGIEKEVRNLVADLNSSLKRLQLLEKNVVVAEKSFEITRQRYADGDIDSQALALERNRLNTAYTSHLNAYIKYQLMLSDITRKTFYDFQKNELIK